MASSSCGTSRPLHEQHAAPDGPDPLGALRRQPGGPAHRRHVGAVARLRNATATSAGGIVIDWRSGSPYLVVGMRRRERDSVTWTLPKGTPSRGETIEETALREVREETGLEVRITRPLDSIEYWFAKRGTRIHKTVHYFLMEATGGDLARHDHEFEQVRWIPFAEASALLTFETERALVELAGREIGWSGAPTSERASGDTERATAASGGAGRPADTHG
jgi:8-oxo-dGTP pyrophosphatase MutT (NUDIX family)